ncbi:MAG: glycosyltransferase family 4 protein [Nocardioidaceae bacterium]
MRIVHVCCTDGFAGVERHVSDLAVAQAALGDEVRVIGGDETRMRASLEAGRVAWGRGATVGEAVRQLRGTSRPDVVNVHMSAAELAVAVSPWLRGVPVVATRHFAAHRGARRVSRAVVRFAARRVSTQIAVSRFVADHVDGPSTVIHTGVPDQPDTVLAAARRRNVLVAQRLEPEKNTALAVEAFGRSGLAAEGWVLELAGDGSQLAELQQLAHRLGIGDAVHFLGHRRDVGDLLLEAGAFLASRGDEAYGLSVLEAMAAGVPVVAAAGGGHLETAGGVDGAALFPVGDATRAGELLRQLADDEALRDRYGVALQRSQRECFGLDRQARLTDELYRTVL